MEHQQDLQQFLDRQALVELVLMERFWRDQGKWDELLACYTTDARVDISWYNGSAAGFVERSRDMAERGLRAKHIILPTYVRIKGDRALIESPGSIHARVRYDGIEADLVSYCRFFSRACRTPKGWRMNTFEALYERDTLTPVDFSELLPIDRTKLSTYRPSYKFLSDVLSRSGYVLMMDKPGDDRPELARAFYAAAAQWLGEDAG